MRDKVWKQELVGEEESAYTDLGWMCRSSKSFSGVLGPNRAYSPVCSCAEDSTWCKQVPGVNLELLIPKGRPYSKNALSDVSIPQPPVS